MMRSVSVTVIVRTWSTCGYFTWPQAPASTGWSRHFLGCSRRQEGFDYIAVKELAQPVTPAVPTLRIGVPDLRHYDALLVAGGES